MPLRVSEGGEPSAFTAAAVVESVEDFRALDILPTPVSILSSDMSYLGSNRAWQEAFGDAPIASVLGASLCRELPVFAGEVESRVLQPGTRGRFLQVHVAPRLSGWTISARDVSAEVEYDIEIRSQTDWYRRALQAAGEGTWEFDVESESCWISAGLKERLGFKVWETVCTSQVLAKIHPEDRDSYVNQRQMAIDGVATLHAEIRLQTPQGDRWSLVSGAVLRDPTGKAIRMAGMVVDIHERKLIEEQLRELNRALESKVADRTRELAQTNEELQSFCYSVSHDLRGPLRSINGFGKALEEDYGHLFDEQGRDYLRRIRKAAIRLSGLIDGLLNLARITQAGMRREPLDIGEICRELLDDLCRTFPDRKTEFRITPGLKTYGDANLVRLALANLIENAWKFSAKSPVTVIEVALEGEAFFIRDHGAGFNMEYASKLFAPFERLHTETEFPGSGLGLAVVQRVIQRHHGAVWAEGVPGEGATVYFTLPSRKRDRKPSASP